MFGLLSLLCFVLGTATDGQFWQLVCLFVCLCVNEEEGSVAENCLFVAVAWWLGTSGRLYACEMRVIKVKIK